MVLLILTHVGLFLFYSQKTRQYHQLEIEWQRLLPDKEKVEAVINELRTLETKRGQMQTVLIPNKILWAQKLNIVSDNLPKGVWLKKISFADRIFSIEGSAVSRQLEEMINVHSFLSSLKNDKKFPEYFDDIELGSMQRRKIADIEIADFAIAIQLQK